MILFGECFVNISAFCCFEAIGLISIFPGSSLSWDQWYRIAMCLDLGVNLGGLVVAKTSAV
jgi:hypothetical protein